MTSDSHSRSDELDEVLAAYLRAIENGENPSRDELLAKHPDLESELQEFFADHDRMNRLAQPICEATLAPVIAATDRIRYFGDYEVLEEIARGGMGVVFKARQVTLNRIVAIKMILSGHLASPADVERFHTEAEAAAKLDHPGIVPIYEVGQHDGQHYFSMGFVDGISLSAKVAQSPLPAREAAELVRTVAEAVQYAHDKGVIHRDLKPGNILLDYQGRPRVTDFGLAKLTESVSDLTGTGQILGTPGYMPPEQAAGHVNAVGRLSDVYSLGAILCCLLTGRPPFQAATPLETLLQVQNQEPVPPRQLNPAIPLDLDTIVLKCLEKLPARRYASAQLLADELSRYLEGRPILARRIRRAEQFSRWCLREPIVASLSAAVVLALLVGTGVSAYFAIKESERADSEANLATANRKQAEKIQALLESERDAKGDAIDAARKAELERIKSQRQLRIATAERLAATSLLKRSESPDLALLLAIASGRATRHHEEGFLPSSHQTLFDVLAGIRGRPLAGHREGVSCVAISADSRWIVTGSDDKTARIWDLKAENPAINSRVLKGHLEGIACVAISSDSRWLVTGGNDYTGRIWDLTAEDPNANPRVLKGHRGPIRRAAISADSRWIVTVSHDTTARAWDLTAELPDANPRVLIGHGGPIRSLAISSDSRWIVTGSEDKTARLWDLAADDPSASAKTLSGHDGVIICVAMSPDSRRIVTGSGDSTARLWDLTAENPIVLSGHQAPVFSAAFSPDGHWIVTGGGHGDRTARVWDLGAENPAANVRVLSGHQGCISNIAISSDSRWIVTGGAPGDGTARVWDLGAEDPAANARVLAGHQDMISSLAISPDNRWVVTGSYDSLARVWDLLAPNPAANPHILSGHESAIGTIAISPDSRWVITGSGDKTARVWDITAENPVANPRVLNGHEMAIHSLAISPDSRWVVTASGDATARIWSLVREDQSLTPRVLNGHEMAINSVAISPDNRWIVTGSADKTARVWDLSAENPSASCRVLNGHGMAINSVAVSPDSRWVVTGSVDKTARTWDLSVENPAANSRILKGHKEQVWKVAVSPDGHWIVTGSDDGTARIWNFKLDHLDSKPIVLKGDGGSMSEFAISPDSRWLVTASRDTSATARAWELTADDPAANPRVMIANPDAEISTVAISPDSRWAVTGMDDKTVRVWSLSTARPVTNARFLSAERGQISRLAISPDGRWLVTACLFEKTARVWRWQWDGLLELAGRVGRNFTPDEWNLYFPEEPYHKTFPDLPIRGEP